MFAGGGIPEENGVFIIRLWESPSIGVDANDITRAGEGASIRTEGNAWTDLRVAVTSFMPKRLLLLPGACIPQTDYGIVTYARQPAAIRTENNVADPVIVA